MQREMEIAEVHGKRRLASVMVSATGMKEKLLSGFWTQNCNCSWSKYSSTATPHSPAAIATSSSEATPQKHPTNIIIFVRRPGQKYSEKKQSS
jgi:hypothetical protein